MENSYCVKAIKTGILFDLENKNFCGTVRTDFSWGKKFPSVFSHTSISFLKHHESFAYAKNGDMKLAKKIVRECVKPDKILRLRKLYPDAVLLPIMSENMIPLALSLSIGLPVCCGIEMTGEGRRKYMGAMERLLSMPAFTGEIFKGKKFILVDDIVTQGGTLAALRRHVIAQGGKVVAATTLANAMGGNTLAVKEKTVNELLQKFGLPLVSFLQEFGIVLAPSHLTQSQAQYLLAFASVENMRNAAVRLMRKE